jgi:cytochrome c-type biogenesis protein CcmH
MTIWAAAALVGLCSLTLALLLLPLLLRRGHSAGREAYNLAVYRDQLAEVDRDVVRGLLDAEQAEAARAEIGRRILALGSEAPPIGMPHPKMLAGVTLAILAMPVAALLLYDRLGAPGFPDEPLAARGAGSVATGKESPPIDMDEALAQLRAHLAQHPDDLTGWLLLARSEVSLGKYQDGVAAYRRAAALSGQRPAILGDLGEAEVLAANGAVTPEAHAAFESALKDAESAPRSRYYLALEQMQQGDTKGAIAAWQQLIKESPADAAWLPVVRQRIAQAEAKLAGSPDQSSSASSAAAPSTDAVTAAADAAAGAAPEERRAMIDGMVARLAKRLETQPDDLDGWVRLGRSYMVLNRPQDARNAFAHAVALKPDDPALKQAMDQAAAAADTQASGQKPTN